MSYTVILPSMVQQQVMACTWGNGSASNNSVRMWPCLQIPFAVGMKGGGGGWHSVEQLHHGAHLRFETGILLCAMYGARARLQTS